MNPEDIQYDSIDITVDNESEINIDLEMIVPSKFLLDYVNDRMSRLYNPLIHETLDIPKSRAIHVNMLNTISEDKFQSLMFLQNIERDRMVVYNPETLNKPLGKVIVKKKNFTNYDMLLKKNFKNSRVVKAKDKLLLSNRDLMVFNYKLLHEVYVYQQYKLRNFDMVYNNLNEMVFNINNKGEFQHTLVMLDLPINMPNLAELKRLTFKNNNSQSVTAFPDTGSILIYELWKMFYKKADSVFSRITDEKAATVYFVFNNKSKFTIYNLKDLRSLSRSLEVEANKIKPVDELNASKTFLISLAKFRKYSSIPVELLKGLVASEPADIDYDNIDLDLELQELGFIDDDTLIVDDTIETTIDNKSKNIVEARTPVVKEFTKLANDAKEANTILKDNIETATKVKDLSKSENSKLSVLLDEQKDKLFTVNGKPTRLEDILDYDNIDNKISNIPMKDTITVLDKTMLGNTNRNMDNQYLEELYHKDIFNAIYSIQNGGVVITDHIITEQETFLGKSETHILYLKPIDGKPSVVRFIIPVVNSDGIYKMSSNEYMLREQRKDLPIRKTSPTEVLLTSYTGKIFIEKNIYQRDNPSVQFGKKIATSPLFTNIILKSNYPHSLELPKAYTLISGAVSRFTFDKKIDFIFDYKNRLSLLSSDMLTSVQAAESKYNMIFIGKVINSKVCYYMNSKTGILYNISNNVLSSKGDVEGYFQVDINSLPTESANVMVLGKAIPIGIILLNYLGLTELLKKIDTKLVFYPIEEKHKIARDEFSIVLEDGILVFKRNNYKASLILSSLPKEVSMPMTLADLDNKTQLEMMYNLYSLSIAHVNAIGTMETLFLDNITKDALREMHEPTDMHNLLIRAMELLVDDNYKNPNNILDNALVRYERIPGLINRSLARAVGTYRNRNTLSKAKITLDPYEVWKNIGDDSTSMLVEDNNPIATIKQRDNVTYLGEFGRSKITMTISSRIMTPDEVGIISEATPDSGDSGISTYLTHDASIKNLRGMIQPIDISQTSINRALSSANIIHPMIIHDDNNKLSVY